MTGARILQLGERRAARRQDAIVAEAIGRILGPAMNPVLAVLVDPFEEDGQEEKQSGPHHLDRVSADRSDKEGR